MPNYPEVDAVLGPKAEVIGGVHEGAERLSREMASWRPKLQSADTAIISDIPIVTARADEMLRDDAYVRGGSQIHKDNIVGSHFLLNARPQWEVLGLDESWAEAFQNEVESKFNLAASSDNNWFDAARRNTFTEHVRLAVGVFLGSGEVLASVEWLRDRGRPFSTAIQLISPVRLSDPQDRAFDRTKVRGGVERNSFGAPQAYYIRQAHPSDFRDYANTFTWKRIPVRKPWGRLQIIHIVEQSRPDQTRGISEMVSALKEMKITKKFRDVVLQNAVVNATFAASIESEMPRELAAQAIGAQQTDLGDLIAQYGGAYLSAVNEYIAGSENINIDGVKIPHLFPGEKLHLQPAGRIGGVGQDFEQSLLRHIAAALGVSYEQLSRDYTKTNYSSARAAMLETWKFMQARKKLVADKFASMVFRLWFEEALNNGQIETVSANMPNFYDGLNADAYCACDWIGASFGQIDELKETQAAVLRIKYGLSTYEDEHARMGKDWRKQFAQWKREKEILEEYGLAPEEADAINAASGSPRESEDAAA